MADLVADLLRAARLCGSGDARRAPDIARAFPNAPEHSGFALTASLAPGTYEIAAYVWNDRTERWEDARSQTLIVR